MTIKVIPDNELSDSLRAKTQEFVRQCFNDPKFDDGANLYFAPGFSHILTYDGPKLVSYMRTIRREVNWGDRKIVIGGIGDVATAPEYRGQGLATAALKAAMENLKEAGADVALLQTNVEIGAKLYGSAGFVATNKEFEYLDRQGNTTKVKAKDAMLAPVNSQELFDQIISPSTPVMNIGHGSW